MSTTNETVALTDPESPNESVITALTDAAPFARGEVGVADHVPLPLFTAGSDTGVPVLSVTVAFTEATALLAWMTNVGVAVVTT